MASDNQVRNPRGPIRRSRQIVDPVPAPTPPSSRPAVAVYWLDPAGHSRDPEVLPVPSVTLGFIVAETQGYVRIASEWGADFTEGANQNSEFTVMQREVIIEIRPLAEVQSPLDVYHASKKKKPRVRGPRSAPAVPAVPLAGAASGSPSPSQFVGTTIPPGQSSIGSPPGPE